MADTVGSTIESVLDAVCKQEFGAPDTIEKAYAELVLFRECVPALREVAKWAIYTGSVWHYHPFSSRAEAEACNARHKMGQEVRPHNAAARIVDRIDADAVIEAVCRRGDL